jgi:hypothetical protein
MLMTKSGQPSVPGRLITLPRRILKTKTPTYKEDEHGN